MTTAKVHQPRSLPTAHIVAGKVAMTWVKIRIDMPLPTPRSVMSSPSHMMTPVPAVIVRIMTTTGKMLLSYTRPGQPTNSWSLTARVTKAVEFSTASTKVR